MAFMTTRPEFHRR